MNDPDLNQPEFDDEALARLEAKLEVPLGGTEAASGEQLAALRSFGDPRPGATAPARPSFRSSLRASFLAGRFVGDGDPPAVVARALGRLPAPQVRADFRARARAAFLAGDAVAAEPAPVLEAPVSARRTKPVPRPRTARTTTAARPRWAQFGAALAVAAALVAAVWLRSPASSPGSSSDRGSAVAASWTALDGVVPAGLTVEGITVADAADVQARLARGGAVSTGPEGLRLVLGDELVLDLGPHTKARLPGVSVGARNIEFALDEGSLRLATGATFRADGVPRRLLVRTAHVEALALGTIFGVDCDASYSCVCCLEGEVATTARVALAGGEADNLRVGAGRTRVFMGTGQARDLPLVDHHRVPLETLRRLQRV